MHTYFGEPVVAGKQIEYIERLRRTGLFGETGAEVIRFFILKGLEQAVVDGILALDREKASKPKPRRRPR